MQKAGASILIDESIQKQTIIVAFIGAVILLGLLRLLQRR
jgi:uncharacterized membrane protein YeaQ/YmgE (transglycosylase-associated protein family)